MSKIGEQSVFWYVAWIHSLEYFAMQRVEIITYRLITPWKDWEGKISLPLLPWAILGVKVLWLQAFMLKSGPCAPDASRQAVIYCAKRQLNEEDNLLYIGYHCPNCPTTMSSKGQWCSHGLIMDNRMNISMYRHLYYKIVNYHLPLPDTQFREKIAMTIDTWL